MAIPLLRALGATGAAAAALQPEDAEAGLLLGALKEGARIAQRYPTAVAATDNPLDPSLVINTDAINTGGNLEGAVNAAVENMPGVRTRAKTTPGLLNAYQDQMADNLKFLYGQMGDDVVQTAKDWYRGANRIASGMANRYNVTIEQGSGVLAALSPQKDWFMNVSLADRVFDAYEAGIKAGDNLPDKKHKSKLRELYSDDAFSKDVKSVLTKPFTELSELQKAMWVRSHDEAFSNRGYDIISPTGESMGPMLTKKAEPAKTAWGPNSTIAKAIRIIENPDIDNISQQMGEQHKVRNFYNNIVAPEYARDVPEIADVTMDTHAIAAGQLMPLSGSSPAVAANFGTLKGTPSSAVTGASGTYGINADAYRKAAKETGILPREMQSVTWEAVRNLYPAKWKNASNKDAIQGIWEDYGKGRISLDTARSLVLEKAGGVDVPNWASGRSIANDGRSESAVQQGNVSATSIPQSGPNGVDSRTGSKLASTAPAGILGGLVAAKEPTTQEKFQGILDAAANAGQALIAPISEAPFTLMEALTTDTPTSQIRENQARRLAQMDFQPGALGQQYTENAQRAIGNAINNSNLLNALGNIYDRSRILQTPERAINQLPDRARLIGSSLLSAAGL